MNVPSSGNQLHAPGWAARRHDEVLLQQNVRIATTGPRWIHNVQCRNAVQQKTQIQRRIMSRMLLIARSGQQCIVQWAATFDEATVFWLKVALPTRFTVSERQM